MIGWGQLAYGAALSALGAGLVVRFGLRERLAVALAAALAAGAGPAAWNAILHDAGGSGFFHDAPVAVFPVSWQDTGSGVFALAAASLSLGFGVLGSARSARLARVATTAAVVALLVDVYLY